MWFSHTQIPTWFLLVYFKVVVVLKHPPPPGRGPLAFPWLRLIQLEVGQPDTIAAMILVRRRDANSRYRRELKRTALLSTPPEHYDWRQEPSSRPSYLRISLIGAQRPHPSPMGRIPHKRTAAFSRSSVSNVSSRLTVRLPACKLA